MLEVRTYPVVPAAGKKPLAGAGCLYRHIESSRDQDEQITVIGKSRWKTK